ncbi:Uncharacterised protein [Anaerobiospirillum thomasii]|uniref:Carrier domain-containing protein n=1 Tax=Anaerobiospirillum thomasii TaxID=179995 RepID=A0A2X0WN59_9GAMM|nr:phosphopantetheine-binding protein [Anaerobiospirillum thomasii]SPT69546.1 Uncharacterised protein [Anaerobiospirillum thomasii]SPT71897.1 Uncharacterised protein [Anaerobiospirillum thomasii]
MDIYAKIAAIFDEDSLDDSTVLFTLPQWNSINFFALLTLLKEEYGRELPIKEVIECATLGDLLSLCTKES